MNIIIDGNIASGKTTIISELDGTDDRYTFMKEPIDEWTKYRVGDKHILQLFDEDKDKYSYDFQNIVLFTRVDYYRKLPVGSNIISERSIYANQHVFGRMLHHKKHINDLEWKLMDKQFETFRDIFNFTDRETSRNPFHEDLLIFIDTPPNICYERVRERARPGEERVTLEYLTELDTYYHRYLEESTANSIVVIDGSQEIPEVFADVRAALKRHRTFITNKPW